MTALYNQPKMCCAGLLVPQQHNDMLLSKCIIGIAYHHMPVTSQIQHTQVARKQRGVITILLSHN